MCNDDNVHKCLNASRILFLAPIFVSYVWCNRSTEDLLPKCAQQHNCSSIKDGVQLSFNAVYFSAWI